MTDQELPVKSDRTSGQKVFIAAISALGVGFATLALIVLGAEVFQWQGFWTHAGQPIATFLAALVALGAAAIALHNGEEQRRTDRHRWQLQREDDASERQADRDRWEAQVSLNREKLERDRADADRAHTREMVKDLRARFSDATNQLSNGSPTVRRSGAYAMAALADDWHNFGSDDERQTIVDVLCSYLTNPNPTFNEVTSDAGSDGPVRETICKIISAHRSSRHSDSWDEVALRADGADLRGLNLNFLNLARMHLWEADLSGASLISADLTKVGLYAAILRDCNLADSCMEEAYLNSAVLHGAHLSCDLTKADLEEADLSDADLAGTSFDGTRLNYADLRTARNLERVFEFKNIKYVGRAKWTQLQRDWLQSTGVKLDN